MRPGSRTELRSVVRANRRAPGRFIAMAVVAIPGRPADSPLYQRLLVGDEGHMPPLKEPQPSSEEVAFIHEWIARLPNPTVSPTAAAGRDWNQSAPTLM